MTTTTVLQTKDEELIPIKQCAAKNCLYNWQNDCTLINAPAINTVGMCSSYTMIKLDEALLESEKTKQLQELEAKSEVQLPERY